MTFDLHLGPQETGVVRLMSLMTCLLLQGCMESVSKYVYVTARLQTPPVYKLAKRDIRQFINWWSLYPSIHKLSLIQFTAKLVFRVSSRVLPFYLIKPQEHQ